MLLFKIRINVYLHIWYMVLTWCDRSLNLLDTVQLKAEDNFHFGRK